jgi:hypothetical protein
MPSHTQLQVLALSFVDEIVISSSCMILFLILVLSALVAQICMHRVNAVLEHHNSSRFFACRTADFRCWNVAAIVQQAC